MCRELSNGIYPWPGRKWSPFYVECKEKRTLPSMCSGASVIFNFINRNCNIIYSVVNEAFQMSLIQDIPTSLLYVLHESLHRTQEESVIQNQHTELIKITPTYFQSNRRLQTTELDTLSVSPSASSYFTSITLTPSIEHFHLESNKSGQTEFNTIGYPYLSNNVLSSPISLTASHDAHSVDSLTASQMLKSSVSRFTLNIESTSAKHGIASSSEFATSLTDKRINALVDGSSFRYHESETVDHRSAGINLSPVSPLMPEVSITRPTGFSNASAGTSISTSSKESTHLQASITDESSTEIQPSFLYVRSVPEFTPTSISLITNSITPLNKNKSTYSNIGEKQTFMTTRTEEQTSLNNYSETIHGIYQSLSENGGQKPQLTIKSVIRTSLKVSPFLSDIHASETTTPELSNSEFSSDSTKQYSMSSSVFISTPVLMSTPYKIAERTSLSPRSFASTVLPYAHKTNAENGSMVNRPDSSTVTKNITKSTNSKLSGNQHHNNIDIGPSPLSVVTLTSFSIVPNVTKTDIFSVTPTVKSEPINVTNSDFLSKQTSSLAYTVIRKKPEESLSAVIVPTRTLTTDALSEHKLPISGSATLSQSSLSAYSESLQTNQTSNLVNKTAPTSDSLLQVPSSVISTKTILVSAKLFQSSPPISILPIIQTMSESSSQIYLSTMSIKMMSVISSKVFGAFSKPLKESLMSKSTLPSSISPTPAVITSDFYFSSPSLSIASSSLSMTMLSSSFNKSSSVSFSLGQNKSQLRNSSYSPANVLSSSTALYVSNSLLTSSTSLFSIASHTLVLSSTSVYNTSATSSLVETSLWKSLSMSSISSGITPSSLPNRTSVEHSDSGSSDRLTIPLAAGITAGILALAAIVAVVLVLFRRHSSQSRFLADSLTSHL